jgi:hypothetical protein
VILASALVLALGWFGPEPSAATRPTGVPLGIPAPPPDPAPALVSDARTTERSRHYP